MLCLDSSPHEPPLPPAPDPSSSPAFPPPPSPPLPTSSAEPAVPKKLTALKYSEPNSGPREGQASKRSISASPILRPSLSSRGLPLCSHALEQFGQGRL